jgi:hypothetical protein
MKKNIPSAKQESQTGVEIKYFLKISTKIEAIVSPSKKIRAYKPPGLKKNCKHFNYRVFRPRRYFKTRFLTENVHIWG